MLNQTVASSYSCTDGGSGVATCNGPAASGSQVDTASVGNKTFTVTAADMAGNSGSQAATYSVGYNVCQLYDSSKAVHSGAVLPIKLQLCDAANADVSAAAITVSAQKIAQSSTSTTSDVQSVGNANPDNNFRYDSSLGPTGGYIYNLSTKGLSTGTYALTFTVSGETGSSGHRVTFQVR